MSILRFLSDIRNAAIANAIIVIFHIYIAFAVEGIGFLIVVLPIGELIALAYFLKGKRGAALLALPTIAYILIFATNSSEMIESLQDGGDEHIGWGSYILIPFWLLTIIINILTIIAELRKSNQSD